MNKTAKIKKNIEIQELKQELEIMKELGKRAMADMQNLKRRQEEERAHTILRANASLIKSLLPSLDTLYKALEHKPNDIAKEWVEGIEMSTKQIGTSLLEAGLEKIDTTDQKFDPDLHEAVLQGPGEKDMILQELEAGYKLGNFILRHSKVQVGTGE